MTISTPLNYRTEDQNAQVDISEVISQIFTTTTKASSAESQIIKITSIPNKLTIIIQPPTIVYVGEYFPVKVKCQISTGSPVAGLKVQGFMIQSIAELANMDSASVINLMENLASGD